MYQNSKLKHDIEELLTKKRGYVFETPHSENVICMMSGGIDSSISAELCIQKWDAVIYPFYVLRGATAEKWETGSLKKVLNYLGNKYPENVKQLFLTKAAIPAKEVKKNLSRERVVKRGHPLRNSIMQSLAVQYGAMLNDTGVKVRTVLTGSAFSDFFPGSRSVDLRINTLYTCSNMGEWGWQISSPLLEGGLIGRKKYLKKADLIKWGLENNFPLELTRTCTKGEATACGICEECKERIKTFRDVGAKDILKYSCYNGR